MLEMSGDQKPTSSRAEDLKKELFDLQDKRKKIEDELLMHRIVLENVS